MTQGKDNTGYLCFLILAKYLGINVPVKSENRFQKKEETQMQLLLLAKELHIKAKTGAIKKKKLHQISIPVLGRKKDGDYFLILKYQDEKWMILEPNKRQPEYVSDKDFEETWDGTIMAFSSRQSKVVQPHTTFGFKWFIPTILKFKREFVRVLVAVFIIQVIGIMTPLMTQVVVDKVLSHHAMSTLYTISVGILIVYVYELIISLAKNYLFLHTTNRIDVVLSYRLFQHLFALPLKYFETRRVGETIARVRELDSIRSFLTGTPLSSIIDFFFIVVYVAILLVYNVPLTLIVIASIPIFAVLSLVVTPLFKKRLDEKFEAGAQTQSFLVETINGIQTVKSFSLESSFEEKWGNLQADYVKASYKTSMVSSSSGTIATFIQRLVDLLILIFGAKAVLNGNFTVGQLVAFRMLSNRVSAPVLRLVQLWQEYQQASLAVKRIGDIFNAPIEPSSRMNLQTLPTIHGKIIFDKVRFRYRMDAPEVIKDMSFEIKEKTIVGIVGRSGSGKSTISKLIQRLYIPEGGKISIDGMDLSLINPILLRKQIGIVLQENFMFSGTVAENISIHCPNATMDEIVEAAKSAGAHEFILELQEGYHTIIGERGVSLSGGQKQRVAIARAIINNPKVLIFDEATSALDYESESIIQKNLKHICKDKTVLIIAHRLSTLKDADTIMVIDRGNVVEYDTHNSLMEKRGLYYYLYNQQLRGEVE